MTQLLVRTIHRKEREMTTVEEINGRVNRERGYQILQAAATMLSPDNPDPYECIKLAMAMLVLIEDKVKNNGKI